MLACGVRVPGGVIVLKVAREDEAETSRDKRGLK